MRERERIVFVLRTHHMISAHLMSKCIATLTFPERLGESDGALLGFPLNDGLSLGADEGC